MSRETTTDSANGVPAFVRFFDCNDCDGKGATIERINGRPSLKICESCNGAGEFGATEEDLANCDPGSDNPFCRHDWSCTGSAYGGDDDRWCGEGRMLCSKCGADGDA